MSDFCWTMEIKDFFYMMLSHDAFYVQLSPNPFNRNAVYFYFHLMNWRPVIRLWNIIIDLQHTNFFGMMRR